MILSILMKYTVLEDGGFRLHFIKPNLSINKSSKNYLFFFFLKKDALHKTMFCLRDKIKKKSFLSRLNLI